jgi:hypothetical protein
MGGAVGKSSNIEEFKGFICALRDWSEKSLEVRVATINKLREVNVTSR